MPRELCTARGEPLRGHLSLAEQCGLPKVLVVGARFPSLATRTDHSNNSGCRIAHQAAIDIGAPSGQVFLETLERFQLAYGGLYAGVRILPPLMHLFRAAVHVPRQALQGLGALAVLGLHLCRELSEVLGHLPDLNVEVPLQPRLRVRDLFGGCLQHEGLQAAAAEVLQGGDSMPKVHTLAGGALKFGGRSSGQCRKFLVKVASEVRL
mmetsp:Transcript_65430/g.175974  ORF Transcript_65430/g.175974 Transcript_65430/m.175974 type:complete len:208 (-) Transcript_65430:430-1053(-)